MNIKQALASLDPADDNLWTGDGAPRMDVMQNLTRDKVLTRAQVTDANPGFTRETALPSVKADVEGTIAPLPAIVDDGSEQNSETGEVMVEAQEPEQDEETQEPAETTTEQPSEELEQVTQPEPAPTPMTELELLQQELVEKTEEMHAALRGRDEAKRKADALSNEVNALNIKITAATSWDRNASTAGIKAYLKSQNELRLKRAGRLQRFLALTDADPKAVRKAMDLRVPLDAALSGRKPARGTTRPAYTAPAPQ